MIIIWIILVVLTWIGGWFAIGLIESVYPFLLDHGNPIGIKCVLGGIGGLAGFTIGCFLQDLYIKIKHYYTEAPPELVLRSFGFIAFSGIGLHLIYLFISHIALCSAQSWIFLEFLWLGILFFIAKNKIPSICPKFESTSALIQSSFLPSSIWLLETQWLLNYNFWNIFQTGFLEGIFLIPIEVISELYEANYSEYRAKKALLTLNLVKGVSPKRFWIENNPGSNSSSLEERFSFLTDKYQARLITDKYTNLPNTLNFSLCQNILESPYQVGDRLEIYVRDLGNQPNQAKTTLEDGTLILINDGQKYLGSTLRIKIQFILQSVTGSIIFAIPDPRLSKSRD